MMIQKKFVESKGLTWRRYLSTFKKQERAFLLYMYISMNIQRVSWLFPVSILFICNLS